MLAVNRLCNKPTGIRMTQGKLLGLLLLVLSSASLGSGQTDASRQAWIEQRDTSKTKLLEAEFLTIEPDELLRQFQREPNFGMYHDTYIITGAATNKPISRETADAKFQISFRHRLFKGIMPFNSFLMLTYTQKSFWDIYRESSPFGDNNYNPGILLGAPVIKHNQLRGIISLSLEHESNGRDQEASRSWNFVSLSGVYFHNSALSLQAKLWWGIPGKRDNPDLLRYKGYGLLALNYRSFNETFGGSLIINPSAAGINSQLELSLKLKQRDSYYLFLQWCQGYAEGLLHYDRYASMLRIGIALKPPMRSIF